MKNNMFYIQDSRQYVGNDMLFWGRNNSGYVSDLDKAEVYTLSEAIKYASRETDIIWPYDHIESIHRRTVDMQYKDNSLIVEK